MSLDSRNVNTMFKYIFNCKEENKTKEHSFLTKWLDTNTKKKNTKTHPQRTEVTREEH